MTVDAGHQEVTYTLRDGPHDSLTICHAGEDLVLSTDAPTTVAVRPHRAAADAATAARPRTGAPTAPPCALSDHLDARRDVECGR